MKIYEQSKRRIIIKTLLYRFVGVMFTLIFSYMFTKNISKSIKITVLTETFQTLLYFVYEHSWNGIQYGMVLKNIEVINKKIEVKNIKNIKKFEVKHNRK